MLPFAATEVTKSVHVQLVKGKPGFYGTNPMLKNYLVIHPKANSFNISGSNTV